MSLGNTLESEEEAHREHKKRKNEERIETEIFDALLGKNLTTVELLNAVTGNHATVLSVLKRMESTGKVAATQEGKATFYNLVTLPVEKEAA